MIEVILKRFEQPDKIRTFEKGRFEVVRLGGLTIGRATYEHDSWVVGNEPYVSLHFLGAEKYAD